MKFAFASFASVGVFFQKFQRQIKKEFHHSFGHQVMRFYIVYANANYQLT